MKLRIYLYYIIRVSFGMFLVLGSIYNVIKFSGFLERLDGYFSAVTIFDVGFIESLAPLVPFEEFVIGLCLALGVFTKRVLIVAIVLFTFFSLFLLDAGKVDCAIIHLFFSIISFILLKKDNYDLTSFQYSKDFYSVS
ncbi:hypothetical protein [Aquimarina sp. MMG016]|uniref:hypothetical protein n=1 Tax=Aquimarina sp. MMG016 TaxID=2822690 RepID=UPI001B3A29A7|nr:hypothetical protein [Aquimarina sp. MMG016]MBQ4822846.1 hypothetical protein [Aquimarina sp. MMG016]